MSPGGGTGQPCSALPAGVPACPYALSHIFEPQNVLTRLPLPLTEKSCRTAAHPAPNQSRAGRWCTAKAWKKNPGASHRHRAPAAAHSPKRFPCLGPSSRAAGSWDETAQTKPGQGDKIAPHPRSEFWGSYNIRSSPEPQPAHGSVVYHTLYFGVQCTPGPATSVSLMLLHAQVPPAWLPF